MTDQMQNILKMIFLALKTPPLTQVFLTRNIICNICCTKSVIKFKVQYHIWCGLTLQYKFKVKNRVGRNFNLKMGIVGFCHTKFYDYLFFFISKRLKTAFKPVFQYKISISICVCLWKIVNRYCSIKKSGSNVFQPEPYRR